MQKQKKKKWEASGFVRECACAICLCVAHLRWTPCASSHLDKSPLSPLPPPPPPLLSLMSEFCIIYLCWYTASTHHPSTEQISLPMTTKITHTKRSHHFWSRIKISTDVVVVVVAAITISPPSPHEHTRTHSPNAKPYEMRSNRLHKVHPKTSRKKKWTERKAAKLSGECERKKKYDEQKQPRNTYSQNIIVIIMRHGAIRKRETQIKRNYRRYYYYYFLCCFTLFDRYICAHAWMSVPHTLLMRLFLADCSSLSSWPSASLYFIKIYLLSYFRVDSRISYDADVVDAVFFSSSSVFFFFAPNVATSFKFF